MRDVKKNHLLNYDDWADGFFAPRGTNAFKLLFEAGNVLTEMPDGCENASYYPKCAEKLPKEWDMHDFFSVVQSSNRYLRKLKKILWKILKLKQGQKWKTKKIEIFEKDDMFEFGGELPDKLKEDIVLFADYVPVYAETILRNNVRLTHDIETEIDDFIHGNGLEEKTVGVHIRATDKKSRRNYHAFIDKLQKFVLENEVNKIYLATDNPEVELEFRRIFESRLYTWTKFIPEVKSGGIHHWAKECGEDEVILRMARESVIDMFILSKMEYLFYQKGSTFSEISRIFHPNQKKCMNWVSF